MAQVRILALVAAFGLLAMLAGASAATSDYTKFVKDTVAEHPVVVFSKSYCPYCKRAKQVFTQLSVKPFVIELDERDDGQDIQTALAGIVGRRTVPQVFINGLHLGGSDDTVAAHDSGKLAHLVGKASEPEL